MLKTLMLSALVATMPFAALAQVDTKAPAAKLCITELSKKFGVPKSDIAIYDMLQSEAATVVFMTVGSKSGAWKCFITPQGKFDGIEDAE